MNKFANFLSIAFLGLASVTLMGLEIKPLGWTFLAIGAIATFLWCQKTFKKDILLIYLSLAFLGLAHISTSLNDAVAIPFGIFLFLAVAGPYAISHFLYKDSSVKFSFHHGRNWYKTEVLYILAAIVVA